MKKPIWILIGALNIGAWLLVWWLLQPTQPQVPHQTKQQADPPQTLGRNRPGTSPPTDAVEKVGPTNPRSGPAESLVWKIRVADAQGQALPGTRVRLQATPGDGLIYERACDAQGTTRFTGPHVDAVEITAIAPGYAPGHARLRRDSPQTRIELIRSPTPPHADQARVVAGKVVDPQGRPLAGVNVTCSRCLDTRALRTGDDGRFRFEALFPGAVLTFAKQGWRPEERDDFADVATVVLEAFPTFRAQVIDRADNRPVETFGFTLTTQHVSFWAEHKLQKHTNGMFQVAGVPTDQELICHIVLPNRYAMEHRIQYEANASNAVHRIWVDSRPGRLSIQVVNEAGDPLPQASAKFYGKNLAFGQLANPLGLIRSQELLLDHRFTVHVAAPGYLRQSLDDLLPTALDDPQDPLVVILGRATQVTVIVNQDQYPSVTHLNARNQAGVLYEAKHRDSGVFTFSGLPPGPVTLEVDGEETWRVEADIHTQEHQEILLGDPSGVTISGRFFVGNTLKTEGVLVFGREDEPLRNIACAKDGTFQVRHCQPGRYMIGLPHSQNGYFRRLGDQAPFLRSIEVGDRDMPNLNLQIANPLRIKGCLSQSTHLKLTGTTDEGATYSEILSHNVGTRFNFYGIPPGRYDLYYEAAGPGSDLVLLQRDIALSQDVDLCNAP